MLAYSIVPPVILILSVLGTIYLGIAPATEAAGIGAFVATLLAIFYRRLNWNTLKESALDTVKVSSMIFLVASMAFMFTGVFIGAGCGNVVKDIVLAAPGGTWGIFGIIMLIVFILGFFLDWIGIVLILVPIVTPIVVSLKFDPVWFAMMFCVNLQSALMTPPFAPAIFFLRGVAPPELNLSMAEIISGVMPFVVLVLVGLLLCVAFPEIILWLPNRMIK
jgi:tripartite ATP-independent transporter DctM subunit